MACSNETLIPETNGAADTPVDSVDDRKNLFDIPIEVMARVLLWAGGHNEPGRSRSISGFRASCRWARDAADSSGYHFLLLCARWGRPSVWSSWIEPLRDARVATGRTGLSALPSEYSDKDPQKFDRLNYAYHNLSLLDPVRSLPTTPFVLFDNWPRCRLARVELAHGRISLVSIGLSHPEPSASASFGSLFLSRELIGTPFTC